MSVPLKKTSSQIIDYFSVRVDGKEVPVDYKTEKYGRPVCVTPVTLATKEVEVEFSGTSVNREIRDGDKNPRPLRLKPEEIQQYTADYSHLRGIRSPQCRNLLAEQGLIKRTDETTFGFVVRALDYAQHTMGVKYNPIEERTPVNAAEMFTFFRTGECDNLTTFTTILLRGNGIPTIGNGGFFKNVLTGDIRAHAAMDFYSEEIGAWVPVDPTEVFAAKQRVSAKLVGKDAPYALQGSAIFCPHHDVDYELRKQAPGQFPPYNLKVGYMIRPRIYTSKGRWSLGGANIYPEILDFRPLTIVREQ